MMNPTKPLFFEFAEFRVDSERRLLLRDGEQISLTPKVFDLLLVFIENRGEVLEKDRLMGLLWTDSFVEESNLVQNVAVLRRALGEKSKENKFIITIPGRGYRFIAEVATTNSTAVQNRNHTIDDRKAPLPPAGSVLTLVRPSSAAGPAVAFAHEERSAPELSVQAKDDAPTVIPSAVDTPEPALFSSYRIAAILGLFAAAILATFLVISYLRPPAAAEDSVAKIAVLPPKPVDVEKRDRGMEFAIVHSLILKLGESQNFNVSQLSAVRRFVEQEEDPIKAGRELGVDFVLASDYQLSDGRIRVTSQLLNVSMGNSEQTIRTEAITTNVFAMQDAVANEIGNGVLQRFGRPSTNFAGKRGTQNQEAHNLFYEALYLVDKNNRDDSAKAADLLGQAVILDPGFADAWALRSQAYCQFGHAGGGVPNQVFTIAEPMLDKALVLDSNNATALMVRGTINRDYHWKFGEAYRDLKRSIEIDPNVGQAHRGLASLYYIEGRSAEAIEEARKAVDINPTSAKDRSLLGTYLVAAGLRDEGVAQIKRAIELDPSFPYTYDTLWQLYHREGDETNAYANFLKVKEAFKTRPEDLANLRKAYATAGWPGVLREDLRLARLQDQPGQYSGSKFYIATLAALTGEKDVAFQYLEEAFRYRHVSISYLKVDRRLDNLRTDPRFDELLRRAGLS